MTQNTETTTVVFLMKPLHLAKCLYNDILLKTLTLYLINQYNVADCNFEIKQANYAVNLKTLIIIWHANCNDNEECLEHVKSNLSSMLHHIQAGDCISSLHIPDYHSHI